MIYLDSASVDPRFNLALEQYVFDEMDRSQTYFMLWQNAPSIIIGKNQSAAAEIDGDYVRSRGIPVVRRLSGGGAVYHDLGNLNFTFITDHDETAGIDLVPFCRIVTDALMTYGVEAQVSGRNDITVDGRKISGNAQYVREGRVMHHGCILFDTDLTVLGRALRPDRAKIRSKGIDSVASRVANLSEFLPEGTDVADFKKRMLLAAARGGDFTMHELSPKEIRRIEEIKTGRYDLWEWNYGRSPAYEIERTEYIPGCGTVRVGCGVKEGLIAEVSITGDFFGARDVSELCAALPGVRAEREEVTRRLVELSPGEFIAGIAAEQLAGLLVP
ncbi:MAG: lipoate--protein ligase [Lachnospiraceae bacterium]|nr:lipoate--protein ligase [Lachnospiraceae bacterium]